MDTCSAATYLDFFFCLFACVAMKSFAYFILLFIGRFYRISDGLSIIGMIDVTLVCIRTNLHLP